MSADPVAPPEHVRLLAADLAEHYQSSRFLHCTGMGELVSESLSILRAHHESAGPEAAPEMMM